MAALPWVIAHGGTAGLVVEISAAVVVGVLLVWALVRGGRGYPENDEGGP